MGNVYGRVNHLAEQLTMRRTDISKLQFGRCNPSKAKQDSQAAAQLSAHRNARDTPSDDQSDSSSSPSPPQAAPSVRITRQVSRQMRAAAATARQQTRARGQLADLAQNHSRAQHGRSRLRRSARIASSIAAATGGSVRVVSPSLISSHGAASRSACVRRSMRLRQASRQRSSSNDRSAS